MGITIKTSNNKILDKNDIIIKPEDIETFFNLSSILTSSSCKCCKKEIIIILDDEGYINTQATLEETKKILINCF